MGVERRLRRSRVGSLGGRWGRREVDEGIDGAIEGGSRGARWVIEGGSRGIDGDRGAIEVGVR